MYAQFIRTATEMIRAINSPSIKSLCKCVDSPNEQLCQLNYFERWSQSTRKKLFNVKKLVGIPLKNSHILLSLRIWLRFTRIGNCSATLIRIDQPTLLSHLWNSTAWKWSVFGVFVVRIFPDSDWIRTRKTQNTNTFHAVSLATSTLLDWSVFPHSK